MKSKIDKERKKEIKKSRDDNENQKYRDFNSCPAFSVSSSFQQKTVVSLW